MSREPIDDGAPDGALDHREPRDTAPRIRPAAPGDRETIVAFNRAMALETEGKELDPATLRAGVEALLADRSHGRYFLAGWGGEPAGQLMVTYEWSDWRNGRIWWIQSVYVAPAHRRRGVYAALHAHVRGAARADGAVGLRLYVDRANRIARSTYLSLGMRESRYVMLEELWD